MGPGPDPHSFEGIEGDVNVSPARAEWSRRHIGVEARRWLDEDARYFLHQALSTPCLNVLARADGIYPLVITRDELERALAIVDDCLTQVERA